MAEKKKKPGEENILSKKELIVLIYALDQDQLQRNSQEKAP